ncbi:probable vesicular acetylcholine transporter-B [Anneissia japonica]|uniref:probable vesicular acetylcholine transporter-B n=1 Tax=Anneissia japonica TaxID=1529436 RepID=UPI0014256F50|nr:probable vesicular acetylcholine transporter-B [Anneissia japonica]
MAISRPSTCIKITGFLVALLLSRTLVTIIISFIPQWFPMKSCIDDDENTTCTDSNIQQAKEELSISILYATSQITTLLVSPLIGILVDAVGFDEPILVGILCLFSTSILFAFANDLYFFILARILHGIGASLIFIAGTGLVSCSNYSPQIINNIYSLEWLIYGFDVFGPVYGGFAVSLFGQQGTFFILAFILIGNMCLFISGMMVSDSDTPDEGLTEKKPETLQDTCRSTTHTQQGFMNLLKNPHIVSSAILISVAVMPKAFLDPVLPVWMTRDFDAVSWEIAMVYLPQWICFELAILFSTFIIHKMINKTWLLIFINLQSIAFSSLSLYMVSAEWAIAVPTSCLSFTSTIVRFLIFSIMAFLSRQLFPLDVGRIFAIYDFFTILPFAVGPLLSLPVYEYAGMFWLGFTMCVISICASPLSFVFRGVFDVQAEDEKERLSINQAQEPKYTTTPVHQQESLKQNSFKRKSSKSN